MEHERRWAVRKQNIQKDTADCKYSAMNASTRAFTDAARGCTCIEIMRGKSQDWITYGIAANAIYEHAPRRSLEHRGKNHSDLLDIRREKVNISSNVPPAHVYINLPVIAWHTTRHEKYKFNGRMASLGYYWIIHPQLYFVAVIVN